MPVSRMHALLGRSALRRTELTAQETAAEDEQVQVQTRLDKAFQMEHEEYRDKVRELETEYYAGDYVD